MAAPKSKKLLLPPPGDDQPVPAPRELQRRPSRSTPTLYRRALVSHLFRLGQSVPEILEHLKIEFYIEDATEYIVEQDLKILKKQWRVQTQLSVDEAIKQQVITLDALLVDAMALRERGMFKEAADLTIHVEKRRANLLGLDKARKFEVTAKRGEDMSDAEIEEILKNRNADVDTGEGDGD